MFFGLEKAKPGNSGFKLVTWPLLFTLGQARLNPQASVQQHTMCMHSFSHKCPAILIEKPGSLRRNYGIYDQTFCAIYKFVVSLYAAENISLLISSTRYV